MQTSRKSVSALGIVPLGSVTSNREDPVWFILFILFILFSAPLLSGTKPVQKPEEPQQSACFAPMPMELISTNLLCL